MTDHSLTPFNATAFGGAIADYIDQRAADPADQGEAELKTIKG